jgi:hypothetical protein
MCEKAIFLSYFSSTRATSTELTEQQSSSAHPISGYLLKICEIARKNLQICQKNCNKSLLKGTLSIQPEKKPGSKSDCYRES